MVDNQNRVALILSVDVRGRKKLKLGKKKKSEQRTQPELNR
jgi:hypothetical protein